jgi:hypothetical protein
LKLEDIFEVADVDTRGAAFYLHRRLKEDIYGRTVWRLMTLASGGDQCAGQENGRWDSRVAMIVDNANFGPVDTVRRPKKEVA